MGFGLNYESGGGDIVPIVKYDARSGRIFRVDRSDGINTPVDITRTFKAVLDLENVEVGYMNFDTGGAPEFELTQLGKPLPERPANTKFRQGIRLMMKLGRDCGSDVREMATVAKVGLRGLDELHTAYEASREKQAGQLPIVALKDTIPVTSQGQGQKSTNYQPVFEIVGWAQRPADLVFKPKAKASDNGASRNASGAAGSGAAASQAHGNGSTPPSTGSTKVDPPGAGPSKADPPAQQSTAQAAADDLEDFG